MQNTAEILRTAAARVRLGWTQHEASYHSSSGTRVCALGACALAVGRDVWAFNIYDFEYMRPFDGAVREAARLLRLSDETIDRPWLGGVAMWNDAKDQTAENVAQGLEYAALLWEQEQAQLQAQSDTTSTAPIPANP